MPRLSVLMPARNAASTIVPALRSTLRAMPRDSELLVLDDASSDGTGDLAGGIGDQRIRVITAEQNLGVARGLELLLAEARGEFTARMDADDITLPGRFAAQKRALDRGADLVFSTFQVIGGGIRTPVPPIAFGPPAGTLALLLDNPYPHSTLTARTRSLRGAGGYRSAVTEDYDLWLRAAANGSRIARVGRPGILLRVSPTQVTAANDWLQRIAADPVLRASYDALAEKVWGVTATPWYEHLLFQRTRPLDAEGRAALEPFVERFTASLEGLPPLQRWALARRARHELA